MTFRYNNLLTYLSIAFLILCISYGEAHTQKDITVEAIWQDYEFFPNRVPGFNFLQDGRHFTRLEDNTIKKYDITSGAWVEDIFNAASLKGENILMSPMSGRTICITSISMKS